MSGYRRAYTFSNIVTVVVSEFVLNNIWPNPAIDGLNLSLHSNHTGSADLQVRGVDGRLVKHFTYSYSKGLNKSSFDISDIPAGSYFVVVHDGVTNATTYKQLKVK